jgi:tyrosinase
MTVSTDSAIDRLYCTWQNLSLQTRHYVIAGTLTYNNTPPSREAELDDPLDISAVGLAGVLKMRNAVSALGGSGNPFCYIYA